MTYPVILDMEPPVLYTYSIESAIAEKFEAMIDLGEMNTRMKDFYDVYHLLKNHTVDDVKLDTGLQLSEVIKLISERIKPTYERLIKPGS